MTFYCSHELKEQIKIRLATFYLKIILRRQKISNFITKDNESTAAILRSSRIPMLLAIQHDIRHTHPHSESFSLLLEILNFAVLFFFFSKVE